MKNLAALLLLFILSHTFAQNALNFDGIDDYVATTYPGISSNNARTVEAWIKTTANCDPGLGGVQQVITDWGTFVTGGRFTFNILWSNAIRIEVGGSGLSGSIPINDGEWHHVAVVYNPILPAPYSLYVDGVLDISGSIPTTTNTVLGADLRIGKRVDDARLFDGTIDEVRVWNYARSADEISDNMLNEFCVIPEELVAYYKFNQGISGGVNPLETVLFDQAADSFDGTLLTFALDGAISNWLTGADLWNEYYDDFSVSACISYTVPSGDETYFSSGVYMDTLTSVTGCDSIMTIDLMIGSFETEMSVSGCNEYTVPSGDETYYISGIYNDTLSSVEGCDSILTITLELGNHTESNIEVTACDEYTVPSGLMTYTESGSYIDIIPNASGCDSTINIDLTIINSSFSTLIEEACYTYTAPGGVDTYTESGTYTAIIENEAGCDSIITIILTILEATESEINEEVCGSYTVPSGDTTYYEPGMYTDIILNDVGCDSIITIILTFLSVDVSVSNEDPTLVANLDGASYQWVDCDNDWMEIIGANDQSFTPDADGNYAVIVNDGECTDTSSCESILTSGLNERNTIPFNYYPNPVTDQLIINLDANTTAQMVTILSMDGKQITEKKVDPSSSIFIDMEDLAPGSYLIFIETSENRFSFVVMKD